MVLDLTHADPAWAAALKEANKTLRAELKEEWQQAQTFLIGDPSADDDVVASLADHCGASAHSTPAPAVQPESVCASEKANDPTSVVEFPMSFV